MTPGCERLLDSRAEYHTSPRKAVLGSDSSIGSRAYRMAARIGWTSQGGPTRQDIPTQLTEFVLLVKSFDFPIQKKWHKRREVMKHFTGR